MAWASMRNHHLSLLLVAIVSTAFLAIPFGGLDPSLAADTTAQQKLTNQRSSLTYATDSDEKHVVSSYTSGGLYEALVAETEGLPNDPAQQFNCADTGFFKFFTDLFEVTNKTLIIEMTFGVGSANIAGKSTIPAAVGAAPDGIPIVVLSDVEGTCRASMLRSSYVVPPTIIDGSTTVNVHYTVYTAVTHDFTFFNTIVQATTDVAKALDATKLVAQVTAPALNATITSFNTMLSQNGAKAEFSSVSDQFDMMSSGGVKYSWTAPSGTPFSTSIISKPVLSVFTRTIKSGSNNTYIPDFQGTLDPQRQYGSDLIQEFDPVTGTRVWTSASTYLQTASTGQTYLADLDAAKSSDDFRAKCDTLRTTKLASYSNGLGLDTWDTDIVLYAILSPTDWAYDSAYRDCTPQPVMDVYAALGLGTTVRARAVDIAAINKLMNGLGARLKSGSSDQVAAYLNTVTTDTLTYDDPAGLASAAPAVKHDDIVKALATISATNVGCFAPADASDVAERIGLMVLKDGRRVRMDILTTSSGGDAGVAMIASIDLYLMAPDDVDSIAAVKAVIATNPTRNGSCDLLLGKSFADFDDVKSRKP